MACKQTLRVSHHIAQAKIGPVAAFSAQWRHSVYIRILTWCASRGIVKLNSSLQPSCGSPTL